MKVLARRANGILIFGPVFMALCFAFWLFCAQHPREVSDMYLFEDLYMRFLLISIFFFPVTLWIFVQRLFVPKVIIEYDDHGLYIYRRRKETVVLRYEYLNNLYAEADLQDVVVYVGPRSIFTGYRRRFEIGGILEKIIKTGSLEIRTDDGIVTLKGVHNVKEVKVDIDRLIRKHRRRQEEKNADLLQYAGRGAIEDYLKDRNYL